jgi:phosphoesterase RecJ-like protein
MPKSTLQEIAARIKRAKNVAVFTHMRPDGDALGSAYALSYALNELGIANTVYNESDNPSNLSFMFGEEQWQKKVVPGHDLYVALDSAECERLGALSESFYAAKRLKIDTINVDHHISNEGYAKYDYVRECSANCMNVFQLIKLLGVTFNQRIADCLMTGLLTDSGNFSHDDVEEETFEIAAALKKAGARVSELNYHLFKKQPKARAALYADVMTKIRYAHDDKFAAIFITREKIEKYGADNSMTEGFVDFPLNVDGVEVCASIMEMRSGQYKISLRSKTYANVNQIAAVYGGGGHVRAAGCMIFGELEEVYDKLSYTVSQYL